MIVTLNLPPDIERSFQDEAQVRGLPLDELLSEVILSRVEQTAGHSAAPLPPNSIRPADWNFHHR